MDIQAGAGTSPSRCREIQQGALSQRAMTKQYNGHLEKPAPLAFRGALRGVVY